MKNSTIKEVKSTKAAVVKEVKKTNSQIAPLPINHLQGATQIAEQLKKLNLIKDFSIEGSNSWLWLNSSTAQTDKFREWIKTVMAIQMPIFRVFFNYSGKRNSWYARSKSELELLNDTNYWGCIIKDSKILNVHKNEKVYEQAQLRSQGKKNSWPNIEAKPEAVKELKNSKTETPVLTLSDAVKMLKSAGYKVTEDRK
jgi:hypothetical protein